MISYPRVVHDDVQAAETLGEQARDGINLSGIAYIARTYQMPAAPKQLARPMQVVDASPQQSDARSFRGQALRYRPSDSRSRPGDQGSAPG